MSDLQMSACENHMLSNVDVLEQILRSKRGDPSQWASYWEQDEQDVDEPTEEEIQANPILRILWAAEENKLDIVSAMLDDRPDLVNCQDSDGYHPLHRAAYNNHCDMIELLLSRGADLNAKTSDGWLPLHCACKWNNIQVAEILLQHGTDINTQTNGGHTALHLTVSERDCRNTLQLLLMDKNIDVSIRNSVGDTALDICRRTSNLDSLFEIADPSVNTLKPS